MYNVCCDFINLCVYTVDLCTDAIPFVKQLEMLASLLAGWHGAMGYLTLF